jgi:hypothetical protein
MTKPANVPPPPDGFRIATSTWEVFEAGNIRGIREARGALRVYVNGQWQPGGLDIAISAVPKRPRSRNLPMKWGEYPLREGRNLPYDRIAVPAP